MTTSSDYCDLAWDGYRFRVQRAALEQQSIQYEKLRRQFGDDAVKEFLDGAYEHWKPMVPFHRLFSDSMIERLFMDVTLLFASSRIK